MESPKPASTASGSYAEIVTVGKLAIVRQEHPDTNPTEEEDAKIKGQVCSSGLKRQDFHLASRVMLC